MFNLLIVDDEPAVLNGIQTSLDWDEYGIEIVTTASNGIDAMKILQQAKLHILLTDIRMPEMDGLELIRQVKQTYPAIKVIIISGYDDFEYIKKAIQLGVENYLLKPINKEELSSSISSAIDKIEDDMNKYVHLVKDFNAFKENILYRWLNNTITNYEFMERASLAGIPYQSQEFAVCTLRVLDAASLQEPSLASFSAWNICDELLSPRLPVLIFRDIENQVILVFHGDALTGNLPRIQDALNDCLQKLMFYLQIKVFVTIGKIVQGYDKVNASYLIAKSLQNYSIILPANTIMTFDETILTVQNQSSVQIDFGVFTNFLHMNKEEEALFFVEQMINDLSNSGFTTPVSAKSTIIEFLFHLSNTLKVSALNTKDIPENLQNLYAGFESIKSNTELSGWLKHITQKALGYLNDKNENANPLIKQMIHYLHTSMAQDISLKTLSVKFNVNTSYLGQLFKKETGEMFTNYLNKIRIEKAKELISGTNLKVNEIYGKVGYVNPSHFFRNFKRLTGIAPAEYKELCSGNGK